MTNLLRLILLARLPAVTGWTVVAAGSAARGSVASPIATTSRLATATITSASASPYSSQSIWIYQTLNRHMSCPLKYTPKVRHKTFGVHFTRRQILFGHTRMMAINLNQPHRLRQYWIAMTYKYNGNEIRPIIN